VLLGHSWGTQVGIELIAAYPQYFSAYIAVSQTVDHERATAIASDWLREQIDPNAAPADWRSLNEIPIPARERRLT
jgi:pimeloyl-ACP methyl ester carboxylesterase